jgi:hypothetical protein
MPYSLTEMEVVSARLLIEGVLLPSVGVIGLVGRSTSTITTTELIQIFMNAQYTVLKGYTVANCTYVQYCIC